MSMIRCEKCGGGEFAIAYSREENIICGVCAKCQHSIRVWGAPSYQGPPRPPLPQDAKEALDYAHKNLFRVYAENKALKEDLAKLAGDAAN